MPVLERKDLEPIAAATFADLKARGHKPATGFSIRMTSGTSGSGPLCVVWESGYAGMSVYKDAKRLLVHHGLMNIRLGTVLTMRTLGNDRARVLMVDSSEVSPDVCALLDDYRPDGMYSFPALVVPLVEQLGSSTREKIKNLSFGGAGLAKVHADFFAAWLPATHLRAVYIANEAGCMSDDGCGHTPRNHYHPKQGVTIDIRDIDEDGVGDIYVTTRLTEHVELANYHIGDVGRWSEEPCACGNAMFEVLGRGGYDFIKLGSAIVRQEECDRIAALCEDLFDDYQLEAKTREHRGKLVGALTLRVYRAGRRLSPLDLATISSRFSDHLFLSYGKTLSDLVEAGAMASLSVVASSEPLVHGLKGVRLKQLTQ